MNDWKACVKSCAAFLNSRQERKRKEKTEIYNGIKRIRENTKMEKDQIYEYK